jgi:hypothetical protein
MITSMLCNYIYLFVRYDADGIYIEPELEIKTATDEELVHLSN